MARPRIPPGSLGKVTVREVSAGVFEARVQVGMPSGPPRQIKRRSTSEESARRALKRAASLAAIGVHLAPVSSASTFGDLTLAWMASLSARSHALSTLSAYRALVDSEIIPSKLGRMRAVDVDPVNIAAFYFDLLDRPGIARNALNLVRQAGDHGVMFGLWPTNPARSFRPPRAKANAAPEVPAGADLLVLRAAVLAYAERPGRKGPRPSDLLLDVLDLLLATGMRIGEALAIRWEDLFLESSTPSVRVRDSVVEVRGKGKMVSGNPKTAAGVREIPLPAGVVSTLRRRKPLNARPSDFVFATASGRPNGTQDVHRALRNVRAWAQLPDSLVPHAIRRFVATSLFEADGLDAAARVLGHRRSAVTERHYVRTAPRTPDPQMAISIALRPHHPGAGEPG